MDKSLAGLIGAVALAAGSTAVAAPAAVVPQAASYADLLKPIPGVPAAAAPSGEQPATHAPSVELAAYHHHYRRHYYHRRRPVYHHHHHHYRDL